MRRAYFRPIIDAQQRCRVQATTAPVSWMREDFVPRRQWSDLSERTRRLLVTTAVSDGALRVAALVDIKRRSASQIRVGNGCGPQPSHSSAPRESYRSHTSSSGDVGSPDPTPRHGSGRSGRWTASSQLRPGDWSVSFLVSFMYVYLRASPSTTAL
jgi:hypothetical protein